MFAFVRRQYGGSPCGGHGASALPMGAGERLDLAADAGWGVARVFSVARVDGDEVGASGVRSAWNLPPLAVFRGFATSPLRNAFMPLFLSSCSVERICRHCIKTCRLGNRRR